MIARLDEAVLVFSNHVTLQHLRHCQSCAVDDCNTGQECRSDLERWDRVLWREQERGLSGDNGIEIGNDGAEEAVSPNIAVARRWPRYTAHEEKARDLQSREPGFGAMFCMVVHQGFAAT
ncbi:hypothetical protein [Jannaschia sp. CCS1]|uniref:hypothetical protein n=1 Tax=Jannaschia sp. (strain CCS1) TaxID=290400 RepID=UPI000053C5B3|nr:hypothetical protein [Jannaschia sp. CCS1]ABD55925.1 hypothetical protein Jann_3008 [Jannaschia sp. CCS1]